MPSPPEEDVVSLSVRELNREITTWKSYAYNSDFLTPTDGWSFTLGDDETGDRLLRELKVGMRVTLRVNGNTQGDGYIDEIDIAHSRGSGTDVTVSGRDLLAPVIDGHLDPSTAQFTEAMTFEDVIKKIFAPFGFTKIENDNTSNRGVLTGQTRGGPATGGGHRRRLRRSKPTKFQLHQLKPYPREGAFQFAARLSQRHGLWIWMAADNETLLVSTPDFDQSASGNLVRTRGNTNKRANNILHGTVKRSALDQPSILVCTGRGKGGEKDRAGMRVIIPNLALSGTRIIDELAIMKARYPTAPVIFPESTWKYETFPQTFQKPVFLHDDHSEDLDELNNFALRELALHQRKVFEARYTVEGHTSSNGAVWTIDTIVHVQDEVLGIDEDLYLLGRTFHKSRASGTMTDLHFIRPGTMVF